MVMTDREGYSLVELMIAIAMTAIVLGGVVAMIGYGSKNMNDTQQLVSLQDQAKDVMNHIAAYAMEGTDVTYSATDNMLVVTKNKVTNASGGPVSDPETKCYYWKNGSNMYFEKLGVHDSPPSSADSPADHLLAENVGSINFDIVTNAESHDKVLKIDIKMKDNDAEYTCNKDIHLRNQ